MRARVLALIAAITLASSAPAQDTLDGERRRLAEAKAAAVVAASRAAEFERSAAVERDAAAKARSQEAAVAARITLAEADVAAARARVTIVATLLERQRADLGRREAPVGRLLGALQSLARRPALAAIAQPGSVDDLVHVRAILGSVLPVVRTRTADLRASLAETRRLRADATLAATSLRDGRVALVQQRRALAALRDQHAGRATTLTRAALAQSDRAIALGESARDIIDGMATFATRQDTLAGLERLPGPPRFDAAASSPAPYRLPIEGRLIEGLGEISDAGVRARGLTFAVASAAPVIAPAPGRIVFARPFRRYGTTVIIDHGGGWTTALTGLASTSVAIGAQVKGGDTLGLAPSTGAPTVTVELYRRNRPVDIAAIIG